MDIEDENINFAVLGCGFMGTAILLGLLKKIPQDGTPHIEYTACVRSQQSLLRLKDALGEHQDRVECLIGNFAKAADQANVIILGVPPSELENLLGLRDMDNALASKPVISLLASTPRTKILSALSSNEKNWKWFHIIRIIPSIGAEYLDSVTLIAQTEHAKADLPQDEICNWLFSKIGSIHHIPESLMDEATAVSAACHALAFVGLDAIVDASVAEGLPRNAAMAIAAQSLRSASSLMVKDMTPESLKIAMSVPKSITINSALELEKGNVRTGISDAVRRAIQYARSFTK